MRLSFFLCNILYYTLHIYSVFMCVSLCQHRSFAWLTECAFCYISLSVSTPVKPAAFACQRFVQVTNKDTIEENAGCDFCNEVKITFWYLAMAGYTVMFTFNSNCRTTPLEHITTFLSLCVIVGGPTTLHSLSSSLSLNFFFFLFICLSLSFCLSFCLCSCTAVCLYVCQQHKKKHYGSERATSILLTNKGPEGQRGAIQW